MRIEAVRKSYRRGPEVLAGIDLELTPGRPVVVLGGNGTGKSTLLRIAAGCAAATSGRVLDRPRPVGYLPADLAAADRMSARAWLGHMAAIRGSRRAAAAREAADLLAGLGFTGGLDAPMTQLSTGNMTKVGLAQALCGAPGLVVLDEPWSGLDDGAAAALDDRLAAATAVVLVTDHTGRAADLPGARTLRLRAGCLADEPVAAAQPTPAQPTPAQTTRAQTTPAQTTVELHCPADPAVTVAVLPFVARWWSAGGGLDGPRAHRARRRAARRGPGCRVLGAGGPQAVRVLAVARYLGADVLRSQRYLLPLLLHAAVLAVLFGGDPGPPPVPWAASALAVYPIAAWFALIVSHVEDPVRRMVTASAAGGWAPVAAATALVALAGDVVLVALSVLWPVLLGGYAYPPSTVLLGVVAHTAAAATGTAVGLLCARPVVMRIGRSALLGVTVVVVTAVQPWLPPVGTAVRALSDATGPPLVDAALALTLACGAAAVVWSVDRRR